MTRYLYMYGHYVMVAGIVATGVGVEHAVREAGSGSTCLYLRGAR
jgi:low temperature requirement protein LtrA